MGHFKDSTVYQIYTKSFQDTTGNGLGDIRGVICGGTDLGSGHKGHGMHV